MNAKIPLATPQQPRQMDEPISASSSSSGDSLELNSQRMPPIISMDPSKTGNMPAPNPVALPTALALTCSTAARPSRHKRPGASNSFLLMLTFKRTTFLRGPAGRQFNGPADLSQSCEDGKPDFRPDHYRNITVCQCWPLGAAVSTGSCLKSRPELRLQLLSSALVPWMVRRTAGPTKHP